VYPGRTISPPDGLPAGAGKDGHVIPLGRDPVLVIAQSVTPGIVTNSMGVGSPPALLLMYGQLEAWTTPHRRTAHAVRRIIFRIILKSPFISKYFGLRAYHLSGGWSGMPTGPMGKTWDAVR